ncbi:LEA type 2 family protein [uncultured Tenacibaculum sp.]|uniref:LEA type 2 family protein n=1 Tax=uncultured Tenacibaculum sp. TaxID=174713 RepID=UPI00262A98D9|nr:LEA type 2 family protein [uncultured Tenacibaculum sp.]
MMKRFTYFSILFLFITSCSVKKKPIFLKLDDIKIVSFKMDTIRLKAMAYFKNENDIGGKISTDKVKVIINGSEVAEVFSEQFKVPANKGFSIPLKVIIPSKKVFENNKGGILGGILNSVLNKSLDVTFKGNIKYKVLGFSSTYPIDKTEKIKF